MITRQVSAVFLEHFLPFMFPEYIPGLLGSRDSILFASCKSQLVPASDRSPGIAKLAREGSHILFNRITFDAKIMGGRACIRGMRITVALVANLVANGMTIDEIIREYPDLQPDDVREALAYASA